MATAALNGTLIDRSLATLGVPGVVGIALLAFAGAFYAATVVPTLDSLTRLEDARRAAETRRPLHAAVPDANPEVALNAFLEQVPSLDTLDALAEGIFEVGRKYGVALSQASYRLTGEPGSTRLVRYEASYTTRAQYYRLRLMLRELLLRMPTLAIEEVSLQRQQVTTQDAEVTLKVAIYLDRS